MPHKGPLKQMAKALALEFASPQGRGHVDPCRQLTVMASDHFIVTRYWAPAHVAGVPACALHLVSPVHRVSSDVLVDARDGQVPSPLLAV